MIGRLKALARDDSLKGRSLRGTLWTTAGFGAASALRLFSNLVLTRLLVPEAFGLMALATVFLAGLNLMSDLGTRKSVMRSQRGEEPAFLRTAWTIQAIRGVGLGVIAALLAWPAAKLYDAPELFAVLAVMAVTPVFKGFVSISNATMGRNLDLKRVTLIDLFSQIVSVAVMIYTAWLLQSVWALVIGALVGSVIKLVLSHMLLTPFKHRLLLEPEATGEIVRYGRWILLGTLFTFLGGRGITAVHGALVPLETLGILAISTLLVAAVEDLVHRLLTSVGFPAMAQVIRERPADLPRALNKLRYRMLLAGLAILVTVSLFAQPLIDLLYDDRYALAGAFLTLQALNGTFRILSMPYQNAMLALGGSGPHSAVMFASAALGISGTVAGFLLYGPYGMIMGMGLAGLVVFAISTGFAVKGGYANLRFDAIVLAALVALYAWLLTTLPALP
ncbi:MAG: oligosaccharide flippase family protein [Pseudomonadota bacterium]